MALGNLRSHAWAHARVGTYLRGKWLLRELIGVGGMAAVFAATDRDQNQVAIKLLNPSFARVEQLRDRFLRECYIANRVGHPGAVRVFDYDIDHASGEAFLVMELLQGETVGDLLERQGAPFAAASVVEIVLRTLSVLKAAHLQDIIHRDLKPENLFLTTDGKLRVLDFGIASLREHTGNSMMTRIGDVMGTPAYMPPEQAQGRWDQVDARSDLWALGAVAFHLLSGREVHEATDPFLQLQASATRPAPSLANFRPDLPRPLVHAIDRSLAFDRKQRWPTAKAMRVAFRNLGATASPSMLDARLPSTPPSRRRAESVATPHQPAHSEIPVFFSLPSCTVQDHPTADPNATLRPQTDTSGMASNAVEEPRASPARIDAAEQQAQLLFEAACALADWRQASHYLHQAIMAWPAHQAAFEKLETLLTAQQLWDQLVDLYLLRLEAIRDATERESLRARAVAVLSDRLGDLRRASKLHEETQTEDLAVTAKRAAVKK